MDDLKDFREVLHKNFAYDEEDNLYYEFGNHRLRIGLSGPYCDESYKAVLFNGGYDYKIGEYRKASELDEAITKELLKRKTI